MNVKHSCGSLMPLDPLADRFAFEQPDRSTVACRDGQIQWQAEFVVHRRDDVFGEVFVGFRLASVGVGFTDDRATLDARTGHDRKSGTSPVIASDRRIDLGRATKISHPHHQS